MAGSEVTKALVMRHGAGRADTYGAALLDVAQDHLLWLLYELGLFDDESLCFKGGTSLRKCRLGNAGRFSTDLDFVAPNDDKVLEVCGAIEGAKVSGFEFSLAATRGDGRHWSLQVRHPVLGQPDVPASVEFARRPLVLKPERLGFIPSPIHKSYAFTLPIFPIISEAEACAEKLARYRRVSLGRDLYDLWHFAQNPLDEALIRRLWVLKIYCDVVYDNRGTKPLDTIEILRQRDPKEFSPESIGKLTQPVDILKWEKTVRTRFQFLANLDEEEKQFSTCNQRYKREVEVALSAGGFEKKSS